MRMGWGVTSFGGSGDVYHELPEIMITGTGPASDTGALKRALPWALAGGVLFILWARGRKRVR